MSNTDEEIAGKIPVETDNKVLADVTQITRPSANMENGLVSVTGCMAVNVANVNSKHQLAQNNRRNAVLAKEPDYIIEMSSTLTRRCTTLGKTFTASQLQKPQYSLTQQRRGRQRNVLGG